MRPACPRSPFSLRPKAKRRERGRASTRHSTPGLAGMIPRPSTTSRGSSLGGSAKGRPNILRVVRLPHSGTAPVLVVAGVPRVRDAVVDEPVVAVLLPLVKLGPEDRCSHRIKGSGSPPPQHPCRPGRGIEGTFAGDVGAAHQ